MVDAEARNGQASHSISQYTKPCHVADVENDEEVHVTQCADAGPRPVIYFRAAEELKRSWPGSGIYDYGVHPPSHQHMRKRHLRAASVAIRVHMGGECDTFAGHQVSVQASNCLPPRLRNGQEVV